MPNLLRHKCCLRSFAKAMSCITAALRARVIDPRRAQCPTGRHPSSGALGKAESVHTLAAFFKEMERAKSSYWQLRDAARMSS